MKLDIPLCKPRWRTYRSFRNFDVENFNHELNDRLDVSNLLENRDDNEMYETFTNTLSQVTDKYAPLKKKKYLSKSVPYINKTLKQAVYKRRMLFNKFQNYRSASNWEKIRQQRNLLTELKCKSVNQHYIERCVGVCKAKDVSPAVKVRKRAKIRNRYNQAPHQIQDTNGKVTKSQLDITNEIIQEVSPFPAGDHKASTNRRACKHNKTRRI